MFPPEQYPDLKQNRNDTTNIHRMFYDLFIKLKANHYIGKINELITDTEMWRKAFLKVYQEPEVTPYMHLMISHMWFYVQLHGDVDIFNIQGLEKLNDFTSTEYFRATNKQRYIWILTELTNQYNCSKKLTISHFLFKFLYWPNAFKKVYSRIFCTVHERKETKPANTTQKKTKLAKERDQTIRVNSNLVWIRNTQP